MTGVYLHHDETLIQVAHVWPGVFVTQSLSKLQLGYKYIICIFIDYLSSSVVPMLIQRYSLEFPRFF